MSCVWNGRQAERKVVSMTRRDLSHNILVVEHTGGVERWLVVKKVLYPKKVRRTYTHSLLSHLAYFPTSNGFIQVFENVLVVWG